MKILTQQETEQLQELIRNGLLPQEVEPFTYDKNILINWNLWSVDSSLLNDADLILAEVHDPDLRDQTKFRNHLIMTLVNLYIAHLTTPVTWVAYSRNKNHYSTRSRYNPLRISHQYLTAVVDRLTEFGFVDHAMGFYDRRTPARKGKVSKMRPTQKLRDVFRDWHENMISLSPRAETIILRGKDKKPVEYEQDTRDTARMRKRLVEFNEMIAIADIRLDLTPDELDEYNALRIRHKDAPVRYWRKAMHRIFTNGSFRQGGRFYRCWWMEISEEMRQKILIDGEETVEKDYSAIHPTILYAKETGEQPPVPPYMIDGPQTSALVRKVVKKLLLVMINIKKGKDVKTAWVWHRDRYDNFSDAERQEVMALDIDDIIGKIKKHNAPIASHFSSNAGVKLQYEDSLVAERVMATLADQGIVALPIHDSFVVQKQHESALEDAMREAFVHKFGVEPRIK